MRTQVQGCINSSISGVWLLSVHSLGWSCWRCLAAVVCPLFLTWLRRKKKKKRNRWGVITEALHLNHSFTTSLWEPLKVYGNLRNMLSFMKTIQQAGGCESFERLVSMRWQKHSFKQGIQQKKRRKKKRLAPRSLTSTWKDASQIIEWEDQTATWKGPV